VTAPRHNEGPDAPEPVADRPPRPAKAEPERRCILTGRHGGPDDMLRLALGPDGQVAVDFASRLPGRGAWVSLDRAGLAKALKSGKLKGALARALHQDAASLSLPADLVEQTRAGLQKRVADRLGLERRAGHILTGFDVIADTLRKALEGRRDARLLLIHASDAATDGSAKLDGLARALELDPPSRSGLSRHEMGLALGRENVVHVLVTDADAASRVSRELDRFSVFSCEPADKP
jgi:uncharacterized protein